MYTEDAAKLAELCAGWFEGSTGDEMAQHIADEIRARIDNPTALLNQNSQSGQSKEMR